MNITSAPTSSDERQEPLTTPRNLGVHNILNPSQAYAGQMEAPQDIKGPNSIDEAYEYPAFDIGDEDHEYSGGNFINDANTGPYFIDEVYEYTEPSPAVWPGQEWSLTELMPAESWSDLYEKEAGSPADNVPNKPMDKRYTCPYGRGCEMTFSNRRDASRHFNTHHPKAAKAISIPCTISGCTKKFTRVDNMKRHLIKVHSKNKTRMSDGSRPSVGEQATEQRRLAEDAEPQKAKEELEEIKQLQRDRDVKRFKEEMELRDTVEEEYKRRPSEDLITSDLDSGTPLPNEAIFNRKDLYTQHIRQIHMPDEDDIPGSMGKEKEGDEHSSRPTYTRMTRRHVSIETLRAHGIDFEYDTVGLCFSFHPIHRFIARS